MPLSGKDPEASEERIEANLEICLDYTLVNSISGPILLDMMIFGCTLRRRTWPKLMPFPMS